MRIWSASKPSGTSSTTSSAPRSRGASRPGPAALYSGLKPLPEPGAGFRASRDDRSRRSAAAFGQHPSLSGAPRERCPLAPRNAAYRAAGPLGCAGRIATRLLAARPSPPASLPGSPGLADGQGSWRGLDPASNEGKPNMTKQTNRKPGATAAASATAPDAYPDHGPHRGRPGAGCPPVVQAVGWRSLAGQRVRPGARWAELAQFT